MKAVILAGGYGTRLSEQTDFIPKPMIEIGGRPLLWHLMRIFSAHKITDFTVALGYKGHVIKRYFLDYHHIEQDLEIDLARGAVKPSGSVSEEWKVNLVDTGENVMTGGRLKRLRNHIDDTFIFTYGDGLSNVNLQELLAFHKSHGKLATVTAVRPVSRFGLLDIDSDSKVSNFSEKPKYDNGWVNGGFFVLEPAAIDYIAGDSTSWEKEPCEQLARDGELFAYYHEGFWQCVDTLHELRQLRDQWAEDKALWKTW